MASTKTSSFNEKVVDAIPAQFFMISSSADHQTSDEAYNTGGTFVVTSFFCGRLVIFGLRPSHVDQEKDRLPNLCRLTHLLPFLPPLLPLLVLLLRRHLLLPTYPSTKPVQLSIYPTPMARQEELALVRSYKSCTNEAMKREP